MNKYKELVGSTVDVLAKRREEGGTSIQTVLASKSISHYEFQFDDLAANSFRYQVQFSRIQDWFLKHMLGVYFGLFMSVFLQQLWWL